MAPRTSDELNLALDGEQNASLLGSHRIEDRWREASEENDGMLEDGGIPQYEAMDVSERKRSWWRNATINSFFIASWFGFATLLSLYNKWMFSPAYYGFPFPLFVTTMHMLVQFICSALIRMLWPGTFKPPGTPTVKEYAQKCVPCAVTTGLDIGLSNLSLKTITLSLYTMCKSSSLIFVLLFAFLFKLERFSFRLVAVILLITAGVLLMVLSTDVAGHGPPIPSSTSESASEAVRRSLSLLSNLGGSVFRRVPESLKTPVFMGVIFVFLASAFGGLRWALTQLLLTGAHGSHNEGQKHRSRRSARSRNQSSQEKPRGMGLNNPAATIFFLSPTMFLTLFVVSNLLEGPLPKLASSGFFDSFTGGMKTVGFILFPGALAFAMVMSEYYIIQRTGIVPMSIAGIFKEVVTILLATWFFDDSLTWINWIGLSITICGISVFTYHKYQKSVVDPSTSPSRGGIALPEYDDSRHGDSRYDTPKDDVDEVVDIDQLEDREDQRLMDDDEARRAWSSHSAEDRSDEPLVDGGGSLLFDVDRENGTKNHPSSSLKPSRTQAESTSTAAPISPFSNEPRLFSPLRSDSAEGFSPIFPSTATRSKNRDRRDRKVRFSVVDVDDEEGKGKGEHVLQGMRNTIGERGSHASSQTLDFR
ncbi:Triose-phosphate Transporter [Tulasnella sp. 419]|nr:Triose-phosphate Transporter [Tulasnella sp. 419]